MSKNLKLTFILNAIIACICIAWWTLYSFFRGVGVNYVAILTLFGIFFILFFMDKSIKTRSLDLLVLSGLFVVLESIVFIPFEFELISKIKVYNAFQTMQNVFTILAILYLAYIVFRVIYELKNWRFDLIEVVLGNKKLAKKVKKSKELSNGSLLEKPAKNNMKNVDKNVDDSTGNAPFMFENQETIDTLKLDNNDEE